MGPIDRAALREMAERATKPDDLTCHEPARTDCRECLYMAEQNTRAARARLDLGDMGAAVLALLDALDAAERERDEALAALRKYGQHTAVCASSQPWSGGARALGADLCDCGSAKTSIITRVR